MSTKRGRGYVYLPPGRSIWHAQYYVDGRRVRQSTEQETKEAAETWLETNLLWDVGAAAGKPKTFYAGLGYQYIKNKFGNQPSLPGTKVSSPSIQLEAHF